MNWEMNKKNIFIIIVLLFLGILENIIIIFGNFSYSFCCLFYALASIFNLCITLIGMKKSKSKVFSLVELFIVLSYLFNFGQVYNKVFFKNYRGNLINALDMKSKEFRTVYTFTLNVLLVIAVFMLLYMEKANKTIKKNRIIKSLDSNGVRRMGILTLMATIPFEIYYLYRLLSIATVNAYEGFSSLSINSYIVQLGTFSLIGFSLIICSYSEQKIRGSVAYACAVLFYLLTMLSGSRIYGVVSICVLTYFYINLIYKPDFKKTVVLVIGGIIFLGILNSIMHVRQMGGMSVSAIITYWLNNRENNIIAAIFEEFGGSIYTTRIAMEEIPEQLNYHCGMSYIEMLAWIFPNVGGKISQLIPSVEFTMLFKTKYSYGGNYIAEMYYNFGYFSYFFAAFVGAVISKVSAKIDECVDEKNFTKCAFYIMGMYSAIIWVRSYVDVFPRNIIWSCILLYIIYRAAKGKKNKGYIDDIGCNECL